MGQALFPDPGQDFQAQAEKLQRRRKLAEQLVQSAMQGDGGQGYHGGRIYAVGNQLGNVASSIVGTMLGNQLDQQQQDLAAKDTASRQEFLKANGMENLAAGDNTSLRGVIEKQVGQQLDYPRQREVEAAKQAIENARIEAQDRRQAAQFEQQDKLLGKRLEGQKDLRQTPTVIIHQGGGSRSGATSAPDGKPLSAAQEKAALELGSNRSNLQMLSDTFKDEYAGDLRSTLQRKFGEVAGGAAPQATQNMTRWWADQAFMDELPQRHELFGATLTAGEKAAWASAAINPSLSPKVIRERFETRRSIMENALGRMRASAVAGGKSGQQFDAAVGKPKSQQPERKAPQAALDYLKANPGQKAAFKAKYGYLPEGY